MNGTRYTTRTCMFYYSQKQLFTQRKTTTTPTTTPATAKHNTEQRPSEKKEKTKLTHSLHTAAVWCSAGGAVR